MPFDWRTPHGYAVALGGSYVAIYAVLLGVSPILSFFIGFCWFIVTFVKDITNDLSQFNATELRTMSHAEIRERFSFVIQQLSDVKQLSKIIKLFQIAFEDKSFQEHLVLLSISNHAITTTIINCPLSFRFVNDFNSIYKIIMTYHFVWSLSNIGSTLLVLHIILVRRFWLKLAWKSFDFHSFYNFWFNFFVTVTTKSRPNWDDYAIHFGDMVVFSALLLLRSRTICN